MPTTKLFKTKGVPVRQIAEGVRLYQANGLTSNIEPALKQAGFTRQDIVKALASADIAFSDGKVPNGHYRGTIMPEVICAWQSALGAYRETAATDVIRDLLAINATKGKQTFSLKDLAAAIFDCYGSYQTYRTINQLRDLQQWKDVEAQINNDVKFPNPDMSLWWGA